MHFGEFPFELSAVISKCDFVISDTNLLCKPSFEILNYLQNNPKFLIVAKWHSGKVAN